jgi:1-acyl-sn-glycerol-3-phosphate acyltransferase
MMLVIAIREYWQWSYAQVCSFLYFHKISRVGTGDIPEGPVLFLGTHRNGILDALVYSNVLGRMTFVLAKRLHGNVLGRLFFGGIGVVRDKDARPDGATNKSGNRQALKECRRYLVHGRRLFMFPEGSSSLGPRLQDIKPGAAKIVLSALSARPDLSVVPVSVRYDRPWGFRSRAEVTLGDAIDLKDILAHPMTERFDLVHARICKGLHAITDEFQSAEQQEAFEVANNTRHLIGPGTAYDAPADEEPADLEARWETLKEIASVNGARRYRRVPLYEEGGADAHVLKLVGLGPFVAFMALVNAPVLLGARLAGKKLARGTNVISLFRMLVGLPLMAIWGAATFAALYGAGMAEVWAISLSVSLIGLGSYDTVMRSWTLLQNRRKGASFREAFKAFARCVDAVQPVL